MAPLLFVPRTKGCAKRENEEHVNTLVDVGAGLEAERKEESFVLGA